MVQAYTTGVVVLERNPYWGPELKRRYAGMPIFVHECRSSLDLVSAVATYEKAVVVLAIDSSPADCLNWMTRRLLRGDETSVIAVVSVNMSSLEWAIREAGAVEVVCDDIGGCALSQICLRAIKDLASGGGRWR